jgi:Fic family protein
VTGPPEDAVWPRHERRTVPWQQSIRSGSQADRMLREVVVAIPPVITGRELRLAAAVVAAGESALREIVGLDRDRGAQLGVLGAVLLRSESVASSRIERIEADTAAYSRALHGDRSNAAATAMSVATGAVAQLVGSVTGDAPLELAAILGAHRTLMRDDPTEQQRAGRLRDVQKWIGGSDHSPRGAMYVPPPSGLVARAMDDLLAFASRDDLPVLAQAAIAHAQFESIHPFTDGNGRIGRALINMVLRRRRVTHRIIVPVASALAADREGYFALLDAYRDGDVEQLIRRMADATTIAASESRTTAERIAGLPDVWRATLGPLRRGSATERLLIELTHVPAITADDAHHRIGGSLSSTYTAIDRLVAAGILRPLTDRQRNQVWGVAAILDELDDLAVRIAERVRSGG